MNASVAIQVLPKTEDEKVIEIVDKVIEFIKSFGLKTQVSAFETTVEGDYDVLMDIVKQASLICIKEGAPSVMTYVKVHFCPHGVWTIEEKTKKHE